MLALQMKLCSVKQRKAVVHETGCLAAHATQFGLLTCSLHLLKAKGKLFEKCD